MPIEEPAAADAELIRRAAGGNTGAFADLVRRYRPQVVRTAQGMLGSLDEAEDVAQDVFVRVWHSLPRYRSTGAFAGWLYRICVNACIDVLRRRPEEPGLDGIRPTLQHDPEPSVEEAVLHRDDQLRVRRAVERLPPLTRATLVLREYEQLSYKEIAAVLQIPMGTVMSRLHYARQALAKALSDEGGY